MPMVEEGPRFRDGEIIEVSTAVFAAGRVHQLSDRWVPCRVLHVNSIGQPYVERLDSGASPLYVWPLSLARKSSLR